MSLTIEQAEAWGKWLSATFPKLADDEHNGKIIADHLVGKDWSEFNVRTAIYVSRDLLHWRTNIEMESPEAAMARQQAARDKVIADAEAVKAAAEAARVKAEKKKEREEREWRATNADKLGSSRHTAQSEHAQAEQQRIADAKATFQAATEITNAMLQKEITATINGYTKQNPVTQHVDHPGTAKLRAALRSISVLNNGKPDYARQLAMVRQAIKRLP